MGPGGGAEVAGYWPRYKIGWHWSPTATQHDAIAAVELALAETLLLLGTVPLIDCLTDPYSGEIVTITLATTTGAGSGPSG